MKVNLIIKIGGSVLTDKSQEEKINYELIDKITGIIKDLYNRELSIIIITGVGNIGHRVVAKHGIHKGYNNSLSQRLGLLEAQIRVNKLRNIVLQSLLDMGVPAVQFYASSLAISNNRKPISMKLDTIEHFINLRMIPVISGDVVADDNLGFSVMSGDTIMKQIVCNWDIDLVVFGTNVNGIYTEDPKINPNAKLIKYLNTNVNLENITEGNNIDVSGAMKGKYNTIVDMLNCKNITKVHIINLTKPDNLIKLVDDIPFSYTIINQITN